MHTENKNLLFMYTRIIVLCLNKECNSYEAETTEINFCLEVRHRYPFLETQQLLTCKNMPTYGEIYKTKEWPNRIAWAK